MQDVAEPNLYRDFYSYDDVPRISFNHRRVPMGMPADIWITDTSLRDGQQSVEPYSVKQIVDLYKLMSKLGGPYGVIRQTEFFVYSKKDREALEQCQDLGLKFPEITTWIRANKEDFKLVKDLDDSIEGREVILIEDIMDSGRTLSYLVRILKERRPASFKVVTLLDKPDRRVVDVNIDYTAFEVPDQFVVGYGLDYDQKYRNLPYIGVVEFE